jgi:hypothetical protein
MKWMRSHGKFDENEYRFDTGVYIDGTNRDGGNAMPASSIFWKSKRFRATEIVQSMRAFAGWGRVARSTITDNPTVKITAYDRGTSTATSKAVADNRVDVRFGTRTIGEEFDIEIVGTEGDAAVNSVSVEFVGVGTKRRT